ncbi:right-handed parallel beta-helix repeat-containing protein [Chondromyces apiculatus]|uniref:Right handed beta helix domain-containing protein n=1 Tax=Chondromyces apiculatus DSM 436 TaxID=1192034 RepID=A0A017SX55_9BACT|nr:right-handed parallel beta-helix repeat-containing protein [Chondromyces apiculatus]EYF01362.1 Hypothetical protein CAP_8404 [Chondromyces apiculatus DSM 436]
MTRTGQQGGALQAGLGFGVAAALLAGQAAAVETEISPGDDLNASIAALTPGDVLVLQGGTYSLTSKLTIGVSGTAEAPIVIRAKEGEVPVITRPDAAQNTVNLVQNEYVVLRGLEVTGGSHGIRMDHTRFITIEACNIHDTADVALSANYPGSGYEGLIIRRNNIHHTNGTGEGMYLGCNNNECQVFNSVIEGNWVHDTNQASVAQGDGIELKEGSYGNVIRDNVIHDTNYPCILTYSAVGNGGVNIIERNVMWGCGDHGIQVAADAIVQNNIVLDAAQDGIRSQPHQSGSPSNLTIVHNTVLKAGGDALRMMGATGTVVIANNALYAQAGNALNLGGDLAQVTVRGNVGVGSVAGVSDGFSATGEIGADFVGASYTGAPPNDVFPKVGSALVGVADTGYVVGNDFNGVSREGTADVGAYRFEEGGNPGWTIVAGFKELEEGAGGAGGSGAGGNGSGGSGAGEGGSGAAGNGGNGDGDGDGAGEDEGCGCRVAGGGRMGSGGVMGAWLAVGALGLLAGRRRWRAMR